MSVWWTRLGKVLGFLSWPAVFVVIGRTSRTKVLVKHGDSVLVIKPWLSPSNNWSLPGGGIKGHELSLPAAQRELREEVGLVLKPAQLKSLGMFRQNRGLRFAYEAFYAQLDDEPVIKRRESEIIEASFVPIDQLSHNNSEQHVQAVLSAAQVASRG